MDDLKYGKRNKRGDWAPSAYFNIPPVFVLPPQPLAFAKWLPSYFLPWNLLFAASAAAYALFVLPDVDVMKTLAWGWILRLFVVNCVAVFLFYSAFEYMLYMARTRKSLQVQREIPQRPEQHRLPVRQSKHRGRNPRIRNGGADLDGL